MIAAVKLRPADAVAGGGTSVSLACERVLELMLIHRRNPSVEIERAFSKDPGCVFAHC